LLLLFDFVAHIVSDRRHKLGYLSFNSGVIVFSVHRESEEQVIALHSDIADVSLYRTRNASALTIYLE
jgi:hypothetical protein